MSIQQEQEQQQPLQTFKVKIDGSNEVRRFACPAEFGALASTLAELGVDGVLSYIDDDNDRILFSSDAELAEALRLANQPAVFTIHVSPKSDSAPKQMEEDAAPVSEQQAGEQQAGKGEGEQPDGQQAQDPLEMSDEALWSSLPIWVKHKVIGKSRRLGTFIDKPIDDVAHFVALPEAKQLKIRERAAARRNHKGGKCGGGGFFGGRGGRCGRFGGRPHHPGFFGRGFSFGEPPAHAHGHGHGPFGHPHPHPHPHPHGPFGHPHPHPHPPHPTGADSNDPTGPQHQHGHGHGHHHGHGHRRGGFGFGRPFGFGQFKAHRWSDQPAPEFTRAQDEAMWAAIPPQFKRRFLLKWGIDAQEVTDEQLAQMTLFDALEDQQKNRIRMRMARFAQAAQ